MTLKEFAKKLDAACLEYSYPYFTDEELAIAKENGFVIVYGVDDNLIKVDGAICDEADCYRGGTLKLDIAHRKFVDRNTEESDNVIAIEALWDKAYDEETNLLAWAYMTSIPHRGFMIYKNGESYCMGIVFQVDTLRRVRN